MPGCSGLAVVVICILYRTAVSHDPRSLPGTFLDRAHDPRLDFVTTTCPGTVRTDSATQSAVRRAVQEATGPDERLHVTHTVATHGWGGVLYVDVYAVVANQTLGDLNPELRRAVAVVVDQPFERVTIKWRLSN